ncbi:MAG: DinB family protein [bacterium]
MEGPALIADALGRVNAILHRALEGAPADMLHRMPAPHANSMAWLAWHLTRIQDDHISNLAGLPQLWTGEGWHFRFGMEPDDGELGQGQTFEEAAAFQVESAKPLLAYQDAALERSQAYLSALKPADMDRVLDEPQYDPMPTVGVRLVSVVSDNTQHAGQAIYLRGYFEEKRWARA